MKKREMVFIGVVIIVAILCYLYGKVTAIEQGETVVATVDGKVYGEYSLKQEQVIIVSTSYGINTLHIENGSAYVTDSDCADHICEKTGMVSERGEVICCLPHKFIVEIR